MATAYFDTLERMADDPDVGVILVRGAGRGFCAGADIGGLDATASGEVDSAEPEDLSALAAGAEYAGMTRVIYPAIGLKDVLMSNMIVLFLGLLVSSYPAVKAARFTPVEALAHT